MGRLSAIVSASDGASDRRTTADLAIGQDLNRDLRLDACRGVALWFIYLDHVPDNICSWLTLSRYGFSDTTELFMFVSGVTCALAYGKVQKLDGWFAAISHTLRRSWEIYVAFLALTVACVVIVYLVGVDQFADATNTRVVFEQPGAALSRAAILQYRPVNTDVLPTFVLFHLLFAPLLLLLLRWPSAALAASLSLYGLVQLFGWNLPQWPNRQWFFNPLAWQFLVVLGAWWELGNAELLRSWLASRTATVLAAIYLIAALVIALSWSIQPLDALIPRWLAQLIYPIDKSNLDLLRLLHFLAIVVIVAKFVPADWKGLTTPIMRGAIRCGENSLEIYCAGVLLALGAAVLLKQVSNNPAMQVAVSFAGVAASIALASLLTRMKIESRTQPKLF
jgi:hypothetical protein